MNFDTPLSGSVLYLHYMHFLVAVFGNNGIENYLLESTPFAMAILGQV